MKTNWETKHGERTCYIDLQSNGVTAGEHLDNGASDQGGTCTFAEFLLGRFQDSILKDHGPEVLAEVVAAVEARVGGRRSD